MNNKVLNAAIKIGVMFIWPFLAVFLVGLMLVVFFYIPFAPIDKFTLAEVEKANE